MRILVTGVAGFIGFHIAKFFLEKGFSIQGLDNLNAYYDPRLKKARLALLDRFPNFTFNLIDIADDRAVISFFKQQAFDIVIHLAAQAGVRHSLSHPFAYGQANLIGHLAILEACRQQQPSPHLIYASSSSVYGSNQTPFRESDPVLAPQSLYAATKRAGEILSESYTNLYAIKQTGLRFFTVYGPWGRPDMAPWLFTEAILNGKPIKIFNNGLMERDFTYIDDIVDGIARITEKSMTNRGFSDQKDHKIYNIGHHKPEQLLNFIALIEQHTGRKAIREMLPMQPGDVYKTYADIDAIQRDFGYRPHTSLQQGLPRFIDWFKTYHS